MKPEEAKFLAGVIGQNLQGEWMHTYKAINAINDAKKDYKPAGDSRTAWDLAHHIAICDVGFLQAVASNSFANFPAKCDAKSIPDLANWYKHEMPKALEKVMALDGNHLSKIVESWGMKLPSVSYMMFCNNHMIHHRGQLTTYIRPTGNKVPAMYGGSFDEKMGG
jgi:uncharacterized damage-inducible protein DinB